MKMIIQGQIYEGPKGENDNALYVSDERHDPLAERIATAIYQGGRYATARYWISNKPKTLAQLEENHLRKIFGDVKADYGDNYSDYTGYLWTDEEAVFGGHDLIRELRDHTEKYLYLEIIFHKRKKDL